MPIGEQLTPEQCESIETVSPEVAEAYAELLAILAPGVPVVKAPREVSPEMRAQLEQIQHCERHPQLLTDWSSTANHNPKFPHTADCTCSRCAPLRPDGFSQAAVDAAKAVLLASAPKNGGKR